MVVGVRGRLATEVPKAKAMSILERIKADPRYQVGILYGKPRRGHAEGTVAAHIKELERNLHALYDAGYVSSDHFEKLQVLIHVHDTFKGATAGAGKKNCAIEDPDSHASRARVFLAEFTDDPDLLWITQYHDLGYAVYRKWKSKGRVDDTRLWAGVSKIKDRDLFLLFSVIDSCTASKGRAMIKWFIMRLHEASPAPKWGTEIVDVLPPPENNLDSAIF